MARNFAMLSFSLTSSKKIRRLKSDASRWAYICAHLSELSNYSGMFRYPVVIWASDAGRAPEEIRVCIEDLIKSGLVEYDFDEEVIRIVSWYYKKNAPENSSRIINLIGDYSLRDLENAGMYCRSVSEFIVGSIRRAQGWRPDSSEWPKVRAALKPFIAQVYQDEGEPFLRTLNAELENVGKAVQAEVESLFMPLMELRETETAPPCGQGGGTVGSHTDETRRDLDGNEEENKEIEKKALSDPFPVESSQSEGILRRDAPRAKSKGIFPTEATKNSRLGRGL